MGALWQDVRYGLRMLRKSPGFTTVAVLTLALGIGANTAIFTLVNALLLKSLPGVKDPQQLVLVTDNGWPSLSYPLYEHLCDAGQSFSGLFVSPHVEKRGMMITGSNAAEPERIWAQGVSGNFFSVLGASAILGRMLTPNDDLAGDPQPVVVVSYEFWRRRFGRDPGTIGRVITLDDTPLTIVGVAPPGFYGFVVGTRPDLWWPIHMGPQVAEWDELLESESSEWLQIAGRLKPGVAEAQARDELDVLFKRMLMAQVEGRELSEKERQDLLSHRIELRPAATGFTWHRREFQRLFIVLTVIVGVVLLVACTNLAGLLLARGAARQREFSVRAALGAGRPALIRQLMTESLLLAMTGGLLGLLLAQWGVRLLVHYIPEYGQSVLFELAPDRRILAFTFLISVGTGLLFGLFPAWRNSRHDVTTSLKDQAGNVMGREHGQFWNRTLIVTQIALSCCLLIGAGLFVRTLQKLRALDVGFDRENLLVFELNLGKGYDATRRANLHEEVLRQVRNLPGVRSASISSIRSLSGSEWGWGPSEVAVIGDGATADKVNVRGTGVGLGYFQTMGIPLLMGRDFGPSDQPSDQTGAASPSSRPAIIDQSSARKLFGDENPVGKLLEPCGRSWPPLEVIGVVGDVIHKDLRSGTRVSIYGLETCRSQSLNFFCIRTRGGTPAMAAGLRQVVRDLDPQVEVVGPHTMEDLMNDQLRQERMLSRLSSLFSLSALALAYLGLYGTLSYAVARRTREIGIRMALGAQRRHVLAAVIRQGMTLTLLGCVLGVILAVALTRVVFSLLYGVTPTDPLTLALTVLLLSMVALVSCWLPARRAARVDPMEALRYE